MYLRSHRRPPSVVPAPSQGTRAQRYVTPQPPKAWPGGRRGTALNPGDGGALWTAAAVARGSQTLDSALQARPLGEEWVVCNTAQMVAVCRQLKVNHLISAGFAINGCLLLPPGGMAETSKYGILCSAFRQAVTAVENREAARQELCKERGLWRVALAYGFVFDVEPFVAAIRRRGHR